MQFIVRNPEQPIKFEIFGFDSPVLLVLLPLIFSVIWNAINFGKPTIQEIQKFFRS
ncbi:MAG: photosystem II protein Y [Cyanobacteria bacterium J06632_19]